MTLQDFGISKHTRTLSGGVPLVVFERPGAPISIRVGFQAGSMFDPAILPGMAHFCEHMICSGAKEFPTKESIGLFVEEYGAYFNASTSADMLQMVVDFGDPADAPYICHFLHQLLTTSLFEDTNTDQERGAIQAELGRAMSSPSSYIHRLWKLVAYQQTPIGHDTLGTRESLEQITAADLRQFYTKRLTAQTAGLVVSGGITIDKIGPLLENVVQSHATEMTKQPDIATVREKPLMVKRYRGVSQTHVAVGFASVPIGHRDYWPLAILSRIMARGRTSRLYRRLRQELGLIYALAGFQEDYAGAGRWTVFTDCRNLDLAQVLSVIAEELSRVRQDGINQEELTLAKTFTNKFQRLRMEPASAWSDYHIERVTYRHDLGDLISDSVARDAVTLEDINRAARDYLVPGKWYLAACGDMEEKDLEFNF